MPTTTKMGIVYPSSTDLVKDGATAMGTISTTVDAKTGLVLLSTQTFSGVANQALSSTLSANYKNYKVIVNINNTSLDADVFLRLRNSTTDKSTNYTYGIYGRQITTGAAVSASGTTSGIYMGSADPVTTNNMGYSIDLLNPFVTDRTIGLVQAYYLGSDSNFYTVNTGTIQTEAYSADGINLVITAGTMTGEISLYGYNK
jgi:hypothetical protein